MWPCSAQLVLFIFYLCILVLGLTKTKNTINTTAVYALLNINARLDKIIGFFSQALPSLFNYMVWYIFQLWTKYSFTNSCKTKLCKFTEISHCHIIVSWNGNYIFIEICLEPLYPGVNNLVSAIHDGHLRENKPFVRTRKLRQLTILQLVLGIATSL